MSGRRVHRAVYGAQILCCDARPAGMKLPSSQYSVAALGRSARVWRHRRGGLVNLICVVLGKQRPADRVAGVGLLLTAVSNDDVCADADDFTGTLLL